MGSVWLAEHQTLRTDVVVKFLSEELAEDATSRTRFAREASAAAQVKSPHVVQMLDHGVTPEGSPYIVMEFLEGRDLKQELRHRGRLSAREVASMVDQLSRALDRAHEKGIIHRDIKPANIFLMDVGGGEPFVKLLDFGIAKATHAMTVTTTGDVVGTPMYMSPEQLQGHDAGPPSDLWSLGVCAYRSMTGVHLFGADSVGAVALKVLQAPMPAPTSVHADLPMAVDSWFEKACSRDIGQRFRTAREMSDALWTAIGEPRDGTPGPTRRQPAFGQTPIGGAPAASSPTGTGPLEPNAPPELTGSLGSSVKQAGFPVSPRRSSLVAAVAVPFAVAVVYLFVRFGVSSPSDSSLQALPQAASEPEPTSTIEPQAQDAAATSSAAAMTAASAAATASVTAPQPSASASASASASPPTPPVTKKWAPAPPPAEPDDIGF